MAVCRFFSARPSSPATVTPHPGRQYPERAIVFLPGMGTSGTITARCLLPTLTQYGSVIVLDYPTNSFNQVEIFESLDNALKPFQEVVLVGLSLGAMVGLNYLRHCSALDHRSVPGIVAVDGLSCADDVLQPLQLLNQFPLSLIKGDWPVSAIWPVGQCLYQKLVNIHREPDHDTTYMEEFNRFMQSFPAAGHLAQMRAVVVNQPLHPGEFPAIKAALIDCTENDIFVRPEALERWKAGFPNHLVIPGGRGHVLPPAEPKAIAKALHEALRYLWPAS